MKKITLSFCVALSLGISLTSFIKPDQEPARTALPVPHPRGYGVTLLGPESTPEIVSASTNFDELDVSILVPAGREPDSLFIRSIGGTWINANLMAGSMQIFWPYVDSYNRQCWRFLIPLSQYSLPTNDTYVLHFTDWTHTAAEEVSFFFASW